MANEVKMPQLGLTMEEGTVGRWLVKEGDNVKQGDILAEIETDKITTELESEFEGVVLKLVAKEGEDIKVQGLLAYIGEEGEQLSESTAQEVKEISQTKDDVPDKVEKVKPIERKAGERIKISPLAKKTAEKLNIDYTNISGSGPGGRIRQCDILNYKDQKQTETSVEMAPVNTGSIEIEEGDVSVRLSGMRKVVSERMFAAHAIIPPVTQSVKCNITKLLELRKQINEGREDKISLNDCILKAVAKALSNNKYMLVSMGDGEIIQRGHVNLGMAVALDEGLITPVIRDADKKSLETIAKESKDLSTRAREGQLDTSEYKGATFTVSNLGMMGVDFFTPIINLPNAAILGICATEDELALLDGEVVVNKMMRICLTYDHRLIDGATAAKYELEVKKLLENPMEILI